MKTGGVQWEHGIEIRGLHVKVAKLQIGHLAHLANCNALIRVIKLSEGAEKSSNGSSAYGLGTRCTGHHACA